MRTFHWSAQRNQFSGTSYMPDARCSKFVDLSRTQGYDRSGCRRKFELFRQGICPCWSRNHQRHRKSFWLSHHPESGTRQHGRNRNDQSGVDYHFCHSIENQKEILFYGFGQKENNGLGIRVHQGRRRFVSRGEIPERNCGNRLDIDCRRIDDKP